VYLKRRIKADLRHAPREGFAPELPIEGEIAPPDLVVKEDELTYRVSLGHGLSTGFFTDQREGRALVRRDAGGARVLNLFAYTCSFTVAAARGGAVETTSVDVSQRALTRGAGNLELNALGGPSHRILRADAVAFVARARRRGDLFDTVVLDPPSFGTHGKSTFSVEKDYARVCEDALALLSPAGTLLAVTNHQGTSRTKLRRMVLFAAERLGLSGGELADLAMPEDHPHRPLGFEPTKSVLYRRR
jgi:23S rRNA (cytosine1962-C5)-methyltransferase